MATRARRLSHRPPKVDHVRNDINVTPLVDVMLVLLIIFMLMTLVMGRGHDVKLPAARNFSQEKDKMQPVVSVEADGTLYVEKNKLGLVTEATLKEMQNQVEAAWKAPKNPEGVGRIYLKADTKVEYSKVYPVLEYMNKQMAMSNVDLAITKEDK
ncbi:MAG TPA: biopolymer transporter ExbD [Kofleriaceae bacterium]|nr:biopolymer transporter ExbD [Kofleriaceae bacterium]